MPSPRASAMVRMPSRRPRRGIRIGPRVRVPAAFYRRALRLLHRSGIPFLVGGGYAFERYTGIDRNTVDLDVFVLPEDAPRVLEVFSDHGFVTRMLFPHWLGKVYQRRNYVDVIFSSGNGIARVD